MNLHYTFGSETLFGSLTPLAKSWRLLRFFLLLFQSQPFSLFKDEPGSSRTVPPLSLRLMCNTDDELTKQASTTSCVLLAGGSLFCLSRHLLKSLFGS